MSPSEPETDAVRVAELSWDEVARRLAAGAFAILPVGAGAKQHGWHLPMCADALQAEWLARRLAGHVPALVWPTLTYGHYPAFAAYAGSCSLSPGTFEAVVRELVAALLGYGARTVLVVDTGISTNAPIGRAVAAQAAQDRVLHLRVYAGPRYRAAATSLMTQAHGQHADELETSCLLAIAPGRVRMDRAVAGPPDVPGPGPMQPTDPAAPNYSASGVIGDPSGATAEKGTILLDAMVDDMLAEIRIARSS